MTGRVLVTGATGHVGRPLVADLLRAGVDVRALARDPGRAGLPAEVEVVAGDLTAPDTVAAALSGVDRVFLLWPTPPADATAVVDVIAKDAGRVVVLSSAGIRDDAERQADPITAGHRALERAVQRSGVAWTFLRPGGFAANTLGWADQIRADGVVRQPFGALSRPLIHEADIAAVAAVALLDDRYAGARPVLTGPAALTQVEQAAAIGAAVGRPVGFVEVPVEQARAELAAAWGDPGFVDAVLAGWAGLLTDPEPVTDTVERITGRPPRPFAGWAADHAADFA